MDEDVLVILSSNVKLLEEARTSVFVVSSLSGSVVVFILDNENLPCRIHDDDADDADADRSRCGCS